MSDERYIKLLTEINKYGLDKGCAVEVMAVHNATGQTVKQLCGMHEKEVLRQLIEGYLFQKEQRSKVEAENAALRERLDKAVELPRTEISPYNSNDTLLYYIAAGHIQQECFNNKFPEQLQARLAELKGGKNE